MNSEFCLLVTIQKTVKNFLESFENTILKMHVSIQKVIAHSNI